MILTIHDAHLKKVAFIDNEKQGTLSFYDDTWTRNLQTGSSTYEFSISKKTLVSDTVLNRTYSYLNERAFVSFEYKGETFLFNVMTVEEDEKKIKCYCENLNLELINEYSNPFKADRAMSFVEYCNAMDLLNMTKLSIGINEISDYRRTLEWEGQDTKLARLISLANKFDAEIDFKTYLNDDSTIKQFLVNVYHENDGVNYHGVGRDRKDITLVYGKNLKSIKRKVDKTNIFNMIVPTAQSEENSDQKLTIGSLPNWELKNDKSIVEFYKRGDAIYAPISAQLYPSTFTPETQSDQWIRRDMDFNVKSIQRLETEGLKQLKASAYPELTYEFDGYIDADIGDTVQLSDDGFANTLLIEARIFEQKLSFSTERNWKTTLGNFRALQNKLSNDIQNELERLIENAKPYDIRLSTDNGTTFKNNEGESLVKATLWKGGKVVNQDVSWRWALDGVVTVGMQYLVKARDIDDTAVLTVSGYVGNTEVATTEITLTNVNDGAQGPQGPQGPKGDKGDDGIAGKDGVGLKDTNITYGLSDNDTTQPSNWSSQPPSLVKGKYFWTKTVWTYTDNTTEIGYQKAYIAKDGNNGSDGVAGKDGVGLVNTTLRYCKSNDGVNKPTGTVVASFPDKITPSRSVIDNNVMTGKYVHLEQGKTYILSAETNGNFTNQHSETVSSNNATIWIVNPSFSTWLVISDSNTSSGTKYTHTRPTGDYKIRVNSYTPDNSIWIKNIVFEDGTWSPDIPVVNPGEFLWTRTTWFYSDGTNEQGFSVAKMGEKGDKGDTGPQGIQGLQGPKGDQGIQGPKGADGKTQYTHIAYADNETGAGFSQTDQNKAYIGMYVDFTATDSNDPTKYKWTKWKGSDGAQGIPGKPGADGKTPYIHFAYADDDKGTNFSLTDNNQQFQGYYSDYTEADSTDYRKYKWVDRLANVKLGGDNLITNSAFPENIDNWGYWEVPQANANLYVSTHGFYYNGTRKLFRLDNNTNIGVPASTKRFPVKRNADYSLNIQTFATGNITGLTIYFLGRKSNETDKTFTKVVNVKSYTGSPSTSQTVKWHLTFNSGDCDEGFIRIDNNGTTNGNVSSLFFAELDCYEGTTDRAWQASPKDTQEQIDSKADSALTQEQLNALEAKRLQMEVELKAKATLEQVSELETFINNLKQEDTDGRQKIIEITKAIEERVKDIEPIMEYSQKLQFMDTYITQGNGGMVIGANESTTKVVVTPDRISFQSGGSEVAYISQRMLHIDNGVFTLSLQLGHYITRAHPRNEYVNATYFVK